ncbi:hypothetical protein ASPVEDRAFT_40294 [Aspergillus versicolor CBS 583.65]|uniref:AB hydrolase-1 domain-containing protein n=1 Tax=Aspergillus versicolor CBS 583.65 TaxID=1036611 RepID=A0A1L9PH17_ASPVE|nr:uncharacterized protein ASPVEDRAFT_40294 [Aspergillus versicolor CBS 583.65]OJJ00763.1 hypothetical protein ASPVEDRAFT_40294 [Aspergillus versicolor CBS 583.65]
MSTPTLIFIPGSWHKPTCYNKIITPLQNQHHLKCIAITLPSTTGTPAATFKDDIDAARDAISTETTAGRNVVVIAHSYGGMVGNSAIKGFTRPKETDASNPTQGSVIGLILIASGFTFTGLAFMDPFFGRPPPFWRVNAETGFAEITADPRELFYHDLPPEEGEYWVSQLTSQSLKSLFEGGEYSYSGWLDVPVWYIGSIEDRGLPVVVQRMQMGMGRAMGADAVHRELRTSHSPFLSQPEETVGIVLQAVEAFCVKAGGVELVVGGRDASDAVTAVEASLWKPGTWVKYGIPLAFGNVIGKCVLLFTWGRRLWRGRG